MRGVLTVRSVLSPFAPSVIVPGPLTTTLSSADHLTLEKPAMVKLPLTTFPLTRPLPRSISFAASSRLLPFAAGALTGGLAPVFLSVMLLLAEIRPSRVRVAPPEPATVIVPVDATLTLLLGSSAIWVLAA